MIMVARMAMRDIATLLESGSASQVNRVIVCTMPFVDVGSDLAMWLHPFRNPDHYSIESGASGLREATRQATRLSQQCRPVTSLISHNPSHKWGIRALASERGQCSWCSLLNPEGAGSVNYLLI